MIQSNVSLPPEYVLRKAKPFDMWLIVFFVFKAKLDPSQLRWQQFWVIECDGHLVAFGQIRNFHLAQELGVYLLRQLEAHLTPLSRLL